MKIDLNIYEWETVKNALHKDFVDNQAKANKFRSEGAEWISYQIDADEANKLFLKIINAQKDENNRTD